MRRFGYRGHLPLKDPRGKLANVVDRRRGFTVKEVGISVPRIVRVSQKRAASLQPNVVIAAEGLANETRNDSARRLQTQ